MISPAFLSLLLASANRILPYDLPKIGSVPLAVIIPIALGILGYALGIWIANSLRVKDYGWKLGLILSAFLVSASVVLLGSFKLGVDLQGGVILVYGVDREATKDLDPDGRYDAWEMDSVLERLRKRLNPDGLKEIVIRPFGKEQIEIVVPEADPNEIKQIKERISTGGALRFMIVADSPVRDVKLQERVREINDAPDAAYQRLGRTIRDAQDNMIGYWATAGREKGANAPFRDLALPSYVLRDGRTGKLIDLSPLEQREFVNNPGAFMAYLAERNISQVEVLMTYDSKLDIRGEDLAKAEIGRDENLRPAIFFNMKGVGITKMGELTSDNLPTPERRLGIVFDDELLSAPVIQDRISESGRITGNFSDEEVKFIVDILKSGSMPVVLYKNPISENQIGSILGMDTIIKGTRAIILSLALVLVFMAVYYRFAGLVACFALILNLLLTVALMVLLQAPFTLPGLAGLVLTVGMSVDSNVLIFERIRDELNRGSAFRMALRNGFDRAITTIIDSNLTTLLTAVVLYAIGTDQVRGFGTTLILGILTSMFTAIFCARAIFEVGERTRYLKTLNMMQFIHNPQYNWIKLFAPAATVSVVLIVIGLVATVARGKGLFDIDMVGGTSVTFVLSEPQPDADVRVKVDAMLRGVENEDTKTQASYTINEMTMEGQRSDTVYKLNTSLGSVDRLKELLQKTFTSADGKLLLKTYEMEISAIKPLQSTSPDEPKPEAKLPLGTPPIKQTVPAQEAPKTAAAAEPKVEATNKAKPADAKTDDAKSDDTKPEDAKPEEAKPADAKPAESKEVQEEPAKSDDAPPKEPESAEKSGCEDEPTDATTTADEPATVEAVTAKADEKEPAEPKADDSKAEAKPDDEKPADATPAKSKSDDAKVEATPATEPKGTEPKPAGAIAPEATPAKGDPTVDGPSPAVTTPDLSFPNSPFPATLGPGPGTTPPPIRRPLVETQATVTFPGTEISGQALIDRIQQSGEAVLKEKVPVRVSNPAWNGTDNSTFSTWTVTVPVDEEAATKLLKHVQSEMTGTPAWQTSSEIGGQVSLDTRWRAVMAVLISLLGIAAYVWFRFHQISWGIAAVVALAHDTLIMLGAIAVSYWLAPYFGFLGIEQFKIDLPTVAAFLTLIGYSINDTIVIFDRIREVRGKSPDMTAEMINTSLNQTLARSLLTSLTVLIVVVILYFIGGPGIHTFAFSLVVGAIAGSYSSIFIAAPILLWLLGHKSPVKSKPAARPVMKTSA